MTKHIKKKIVLRGYKWLAVGLLMFQFVASISGKVFQTIHLIQRDFNLVSISPISIIVGLFASISVLLAVFIDRVFLQHKLKSPFQIVALLFGIVGFLYNVFLLVVLIMKGV